MRIAKADLVPTDHKLRPAYADFAELEAECERFCERVNAREHRVTRRPPAVLLQEERERLHPLPKMPHTVCFGQTRKVGWQSTISLGGATYSVPSSLVDEGVWARVDGTELVIVHADSPQGPREVARHALTTPGRPSITDEHYPPCPAGALERRPRARSSEEAAFLALGPVPSSGWSRRPRPARAGCGERSTRPSTSQSSTGRRRSAARSGRVRTPAASPTVTSPRSSPTSSPGR